VADYYDLGTYHRPVSTTSPEAQRWFDRGLIWCYGFHHEEAIKCFKQVTEIDPDCAMAYWGIAYASGPNYNKPWEAFNEADLNQSLEQAYAATQAGLARIAGATATEQALIQSLTHRYPSSTSADHCNAWNDSYADAMREVYRAFPEDLDVCSLFAEALMNRTAWALWNLKTGEPAEGADTTEAMDVLERAMAQMEQAGDERHPGLLHMYIH
jgi:tetratricopeptide (TPR) repeat protein